MNKLINMIGERYGRLTVLELSDRLTWTSNRTEWICRCDCGKTKQVTRGHLVNGYVKSCGCLKEDKLIDITGETFGKLKVLGLSGKQRGKHKYWILQCSCGNKIELVKESFVYGRKDRIQKTDCGCGRKKLKELKEQQILEERVSKSKTKQEQKIYKETLRKLYKAQRECEFLISRAEKKIEQLQWRKLHIHEHNSNPAVGRKKSSTYISWGSMKDRCLNPNYRDYPNYGGRGISVCERWNTFLLFLEDMGEKPAPGWHLHRIDNNKGYEPDNCKWISKSEHAKIHFHNKPD